MEELTQPPIILIYDEKECIDKITLVLNPKTVA